MEQNNITETAQRPNPQTSAPRQAAPQGQDSSCFRWSATGLSAPGYAAKCAADSPCQQRKPVVFG